MFTVNAVGLPAMGNLTTGSTPAANDEFDNDGNTYILATMGAIPAPTLTLTGTQPCALGAIHPMAVVLPGSERRLLGPFPLARWGRRVALAFSDPSGVSLYFFRGAS